MSELRPTYTTEQFAAEVFGGNRSVQFVQKLIRQGLIRPATRRPYLIPRSEAERFINAKAQ